MSVQTNYTASRVQIPKPRRVSRQSSVEALLERIKMDKLAILLAFYAIRDAQPEAAKAILKQAML